MQSTLPSWTCPWFTVKKGHHDHGFHHFTCAKIWENSKPDNRIRILRFDQTRLGMAAQTLNHFVDHKTVSVGAMNSDDFGRYPRSLEYGLLCL